jgi:hypothetical protein
MKLLFELKIREENLNGYTKEDIAELTSDLIKKYWYDEGIVLSNNDEEQTLNIYGL